MDDGSCVNPESLWPGCAGFSYSCGAFPYCTSCQAGYSAGVSWWPCGSNTVSCVRCHATSNSSSNTCAAGTYKSGSSCLACSGTNSYGLPNQYSSAGATSCSTCPENQMSNSTKTGCEDILHGCSQLAPNPVSNSCYPVCLSCGSNSASNSVMPCNGTTAFSLYCHDTPAATCAANSIQMDDGSCVNPESLWPGCAGFSYSCGAFPYCTSCQAGYSAGVSWWPCGSNTVSCVRCH